MTNIILYELQVKCIHVIYLVKVFSIDGSKLKFFKNHQGFMKYFMLFGEKISAYSLDNLRQCLWSK